MAHFAELDDNNVVKQVIVVNNEVLIDNDIESEIKGLEFCQSLLGGNWVQTSYNGKFRFNFAGVGYIYDPIDDAFIPPMPCEHPELELNEFKRWICVNSEHKINVD